MDITIWLIVYSIIFFSGVLAGFMVREVVGSVDRITFIGAILTVVAVFLPIIVSFIGWSPSIFLFGS